MWEGDGCAGLLCQTLKDGDFVAWKTLAARGLRWYKQSHYLATPINDFLVRSWKT